MWWKILARTQGVTDRRRRRWVRSDLWGRSVSTDVESTDVPSPGTLIVTNALPTELLCHNRPDSGVRRTCP